MTKFVVYRQEVHIQPVEIEAPSAKEARRLVKDGKGKWDESHLYFSHDLDPEFWTVEPGWPDSNEPKVSKEKGRTRGETE